MTAQALIRFTQGATVGAPGEALLGDVGEGVTVTNSDNTDVQSWRLELLYVEDGSLLGAPTPGAPVVLAEAASGTTPSHSFLPDVISSYRLRLTVWELPNFEGDFDYDIRNFSVGLGEGMYLPPYQKKPDPHPDKPDELNFGGQPFGWSPLMNDVVASTRVSRGLGAVLGVDGSTGGHDVEVTAGDAIRFTSSNTPTGDVQLTSYAPFDTDAGLRIFAQHAFTGVDLRVYPHPGGWGGVVKNVAAGGSQEAFYLLGKTTGEVAARFGYNQSTNLATLEGWGDSSLRISGLVPPTLFTDVPRWGDVSTRFVVQLSELPNLDGGGPNDYELHAGVYGSRALTGLTVQLIADKSGSVLLPELGSGAEGMTVEVLIHGGRTVTVHHGANGEIDGATSPGFVSVAGDWVGGSDKTAVATFICVEGGSTTRWVTGSSRHRSAIQGWQIAGGTITSTHVSGLQGHRFENTASGAGSVGLRVAPEAHFTVTGLAHGAEQTYSVILSDDGEYDFAISCVVIADGTRHRAKAVVSGTRSGGTLTLDGATFAELPGSSDVQISAFTDAGDLQVRVSNFSGDTASGRGHVGWVRQEVVS